MVFLCSRTICSNSFSFSFIVVGFGFLLVRRMSRWKNYTKLQKKYVHALKIFKNDFFDIFCSLFEMDDVDSCRNFAA